MSFDLIDSFNTLQKVRAELGVGELTTDTAHCLLITLDTLRSQNQGYRSDLLQMQLLTFNLVVASASVGAEGAVHGMSAQLVNEVAEKAEFSTQHLEAQLQLLESEIRDQLSPFDL